MRTQKMFRGLLLLALCAAALSAPRPASAQLTRADSAAVLLAAAEDFANRGANDIAEALYRHILERFPGTSPAEAARTRLEGATDQQSRTGGEVEIKVWSTIFGLYHGGVLLPLAFDWDGSEAVGAGLLVGGPAGLLAGHQLTKARPYSPGQARALTWGASWGTIQGALFATIFDVDTEVAARLMLAGGAVGLATGSLIARREIPAGTGTSAMLGSLWGLWYGVASSVLVELEFQGTGAAMMLAGNAGLIGGAVVGSRVPLSRGRARLISLGGVLGGFAGVGMVLIGQPDSEKVMIGIPMVMSMAGLAVGALATRGGDWADRSDDPRAAASLTPPGSLLNWSEGNWALSTPLPIPARGPALENNGRDDLVWKVPLLKVRF